MVLWSWYCRGPPGPLVPRSSADLALWSCLQVRIYLYKASPYRCPILAQVPVNSLIFVRVPNWQRLWAAKHQASPVQIHVPTTNFGMLLLGQPDCIHDFWAKLSPILLGQKALKGGRCFFGPELPGCVTMSSKFRQNVCIKSSTQFSSTLPTTFASLFCAALRQAYQSTLLARVKKGCLQGRRG